LACPVCSASSRALARGRHAGLERKQGHLALFGLEPRDVVGAEAVEGGFGLLQHWVFHR